MHGGGGDENLELNLTPLLDVVLQLIMFFMITVNFVARDQFNTQIQLPTAQVAAPLDQTADNYETIANKKVLAGLPSNAANVPEARTNLPAVSGASLGMLALGAEGMVAWRREENEAVA